MQAGPSGRPWRGQAALSVQGVRFAAEEGQAGLDGRQRIRGGLARAKRGAHRGPAGACAGR
ncbi:hypothetical protein, partial [Paracraurococcus ruber]|uniref:hypothetical protein n=1 Tax=Paracraurococcus ruber TaxID=77675 RepID=UPI001A90FB97